jgi:hypothetical protein
MKQFYETYREREKLSPVVREIHPGERKTMTNKTPHSFHFREHPR